MSAKSVDYQEYLLDTLQDPEEAVGYLNVALEGGDMQVFLLALKNVLQAQGGISSDMLNVVGMQLKVAKRCLAPNR